jgi:hypothetical protein
MVRPAIAAAIFLLGCSSSSQKTATLSPAVEAAKQICDAYLRCVQHWSPADSAAMEQKYGDASGCWSTRDTAGECQSDCKNGISGYPSGTPDCACHGDADCAAVPGAPRCDLPSGRCMECREDADCDPSTGFPVCEIYGSDFSPYGPGRCAVCSVEDNRGCGGATPACVDSDACRECGGQKDVPCAHGYCDEWQNLCVTDCSSIALCVAGGGTDCNPCGAASAFAACLSASCAAQCSNPNDQGSCIDCGYQQCSASYSACIRASC